MNVGFRCWNRKKLAIQPLKDDNLSVIKAPYKFFSHQKVLKIQNGIFLKYILLYFNTEQKNATSVNCVNNN